MGFQMVAVERNDILIALNSNTVDAVFQSPVAVGGSQVFGLAKNMASINVAPFVGVLLFNQRAWNRIPDRYKPQMINAVRRNEAALDRAIRELEEEMINTMENYGLVVNRLSPEQEQLWYDEIGRVMPGLAGTAFDRGIYNKADAILREYRSR
jgi:TRAP-type C4-dicarboxylate transport system substrate-binding protein